MPLSFQEQARRRAETIWTQQAREEREAWELARLPVASHLRHRHLRTVWTIAGYRGLYRYGRHCQPSEVVAAGRVVARHGEAAAVYVRLVELEDLLVRIVAVGPKPETTPT